MSIFDLLNGPCTRAGCVSCLLVFEIMFRADSHLLPKFQRCQESSPLLRGGCDQLLASLWAILALFQAGLSDCKWGKSRGSPDSIGHSSSDLSSVSPCRDHGHQSAPRLLWAMRISGPTPRGRSQSLWGLGDPQGIPLYPVDGDPLCHLQSLCRT